MNPYINIGIRRLASLLLLLFMCSYLTKTKAQQMLGSSGGFNIPTADILPSGTIKVGANYIGNDLIDGDPKHATHWNLDYNTGIYYITAAPFSWLECSFRETLLKTTRPEDGKEGYFRQDRSINVKFRILKESEFCPAVAIGTSDPYKDEHNIYGCAYGVITKNIHSKILASTYQITVGYLYGLKTLTNYDGFVAGIKYIPDFYKDSSIGVEYDSKGINVGIQALLFNHVSLFAFSREFKDYSAGISYQYTIKY